MAESDLHRQLKRAACSWLWTAGYAAIAEEVEVPGVGIVDVAAAGMWKKYNPRRPVFDLQPVVDRKHAVFIECKAFRADFVRDQGRQGQFAFAVEERANRFRMKRRRKPRHASPALGKFDTCLVRPHANLHYLLTPPKLLCVDEVPRRWGWMVFDSGTIRVLRKPSWQEVADTVLLEGSIARSLTSRRMTQWLGAVRPVLARNNAIPMQASSV